MKVDDIEVLVQGQGDQAVLMIHGWPDTHRLWDAQVEALSQRFRCVRFTLPGFDLSLAGRAYALDEVIATIRRVVETTCPGQRVTLLVHDWGCLYGYQFALRHPELVARVVGVDIGDVGSRAHQASLSAKAKLMVLVYQLWLALAWRIGGGTGDRLARWMAKQLRCPAPPQSVGAQMGYPYAVQWFGVKGGFGKRPVFEPAVPMLYHLRPAQALHVPQPGLARPARRAARQSRAGPAHRPLGDAAAAAGVQRRAARLAGRDRAGMTLR